MWACSCASAPRDETPATNGIGHVLEHMAFKGTATRTVQAINLDAERLGADVNAFTGKDTTGYFMTGLGRHAEQLLRMTADIVLNSTFPESELQRELEVIRQEAIEYEEDPQESSSELLDRAIWGDDPMGMPVIGTVGEHRTLHPATTWSRHVQSHYVRGKDRRRCGRELRRRCLACAGRGTLCSACPRRPTCSCRCRPAPAKYVGHAMARRFTQVSQVFLNIAYPLAPAQQDEMAQQRWRLAASLAANLFGGGMSAPLVDTVREQLGLAYTAHSTMDSGDVWANFVVHAVTTPGQAGRAGDGHGRPAACAGHRHRSGAPGAGEEPADRVPRARRGADLRNDGAGRRRVFTFGRVSDTDGRPLR